MGPGLARSVGSPHSLVGQLPELQPSCHAERSEASPLIREQKTFTGWNICATMDLSHRLARDLSLLLRFEECDGKSRCRDVRCSDPGMPIVPGIVSQKKSHRDREGRVFREPKASAPCFAGKPRPRSSANGLIVAGKSLPPLTGRSSHGILTVRNTHAQARTAPGSKESAAA